MKNWKTTTLGIFAALGMLFPIFGLPREVGEAIATVGVFLLGLFSKDSNVTGGTVRQ